MCSSLVHEIGHAEGKSALKDGDALSSMLQDFPQ